MKRFLCGLLQIIRPVNVVIAMISILLAVMICNPLTGWLDVLAAMMVGALVTAGANAINDYFDLEIDRINRPQRPLPQGLLSPAAARTIALFCSLLALLVAAGINGEALALTVFAVVLVYAYSAVFKKTALWGNVVVGLSTALAFLFGGAVAGEMHKAVMPAVFAFFINGAREIIKDIEDMPGDQKYHARTLPIRFGVRTAQWVTTGMLLMLIVLTVLPFFLRFYGVYYLIAVMVMVNPLLLWVFKELWQPWDDRSLRRMSTRLKTAMFLGLGAIVLGQY